VISSRVRSPSTGAQHSFQGYQDRPGVSRFLRAARPECFMLRAKVPAEQCASRRTCASVRGHIPHILALGDDRRRLQDRPVAPRRVPYCENRDRTPRFVDCEIEVIARAREEQPANGTRKTGRGVGETGLGRQAQTRDSCFELVHKEIRRRSAMFSPPRRDAISLRTRARRKGQRVRGHGVRGDRSVCNTSAASTLWPASSSRSAARRAWCRRARSSSSRSSPLSAGTSSTSVPSGRSTGSSRRRRPPWTLALR
jgi:hypothetical protein